MQLYGEAMRAVKQRQKALRIVRWLMAEESADRFTRVEWSRACVKALDLVDLRTHEAWLSRAQVMGLVAEEVDGSFSVTLQREARIA